MPRQLKLSPKTLQKLNKASWSVWIREFNKVHNPTMFTSVGVVEVNVDEKKNSYPQKSKKSNR